MLLTNYLPKGSEKSAGANMECSFGKQTSEKSARVVNSSLTRKTSPRVLTYCAVGPNTTGVIFCISNDEIGENNGSGGCAKTGGVDFAANNIHRNWDSITPRMALENFAVGPMIGKGNFGRVYPAYYGGKRPVALKVFDTVAFHLENVYKERDLMIELEHKNVCKLLGAFYNGRSFLVLELCIGNVTYMSIIARSKSIVSWVVHLLRALEYLHYRDIIHCDVCPENCLIGYDGILRLSDFGSSEKLSLGEMEIKSNWSRGHPQNQDDVTNEHFLYSKRSDIFAAACCIFYMTTLEDLLGYDVDVKPEEYVLTYKLGRKIVENLKDLEDPNAPRQPLISRVRQSYLGKLLQPMIVESKCRVITPHLALQHHNLQDILKMYHVSDDFIDNGEKTRGGSVMFTKQKFSFEANKFVEGTELSQNMSAFYYDSECFQGPACRATRKQLGPSGRIWAEVGASQPATGTVIEGVGFRNPGHSSSKKTTDDPKACLSLCMDPRFIQRPQTIRLNSPVDFVLLDSNLSSTDEMAPDSSTVFPKSWAKGKGPDVAQCKKPRTDQNDKDKKQLKKSKKKGSDQKMRRESEERRRIAREAERQQQEQKKFYREKKAQKDEKCETLQNINHKSKDHKKKNEKITNRKYGLSLKSFAMAKVKKGTPEPMQIKKQEEREKKQAMDKKQRVSEKGEKKQKKKIHLWECPACNLRKKTKDEIEDHIAQEHMN